MLNVSGNNLDSIRDLEGLRSVSHFTAIDNQLNDMKELAHVFGQWFDLNKLDLMGNPLCHKAKYKDRIIVMAKKLGKYEIWFILDYPSCELLVVILIYDFGTNTNGSDEAARLYRID